MFPSTMLLQTNAYSVPAEKKEAHERLMRRMGEIMTGRGVVFEVYEQVGPRFDRASETSGRYVQVLKFRDKRHLVQVQVAERGDEECQELIARFCEIVDLPGQAERGTFVPGYYASIE